MGWIKNVLLDIAVTVVVAVFVFTSADWAYWVVLVYTPFMLLLKLMAVLSRASSPVKKKVEAAAPAWFFHALYGANVVLLLYANWWMMAIGWAGIWLLSAIQESRRSKKDKS